MTLEEAIQEIPQGWRKAFGKEMYDELSAMIEAQSDVIDNYEVIQVKEKFGELRWYDENGTTQTDEIIDKYSEISSRTCIVCGKPATRITLGWVCPYCTECFEQFYHGAKFIEIGGGKE